MNESRRSLLRKTSIGAFSLAGVGAAAAKDHKSHPGRGKGLQNETEGDETSDSNETEESGTVDETSPNGPDGDWSLRLDEQWEEFDTTRWSVGFIDHEDWIPDDDAAVSGDHVVVTDGQCRLRIESEGNGPNGCYQGVINSSVGGEDWHPSEGVAIDPTAGEGGQYMEARIKMPGRTGILPGFWSMPADTTWPPEIDVVELFQFGDDPSTERQTLHTDVHWTSSTVPGDMDNHRHDGLATNTGLDLTETFNTYGCAWFEDRIEWYFNGELVDARDSPDEMLETLNADGARPFGLMFSNHVNRLGDADLYETWVEEMVIDWVRVWDFAGSSSDDSDTSDGSDEWTVIDDFDGNEFGNWYRTGEWTGSDEVASSGSHSAYTDTKWSPMTWNQQPVFDRGKTLQFAFAFNSSSEQQLNCRFGDTSTDVGNSYRLDIYRDQIALLDTDGWTWLGGDSSYENETTRELHTAEITFGNEGIQIVVDGDVSGSIRVPSTTYAGDVFHFDIDAGGAFIDEVRIRED